MRKDFKNLDIYAAFQPANGAEWQKANGISADWNTPEHIDVKPVYTKEDLEGMEHLGYAAGLPPYLRGPYSVMYTLRPWLALDRLHVLAALLQGLFELAVIVHDIVYVRDAREDLRHAVRLKNKGEIRVAVVFLHGADAFA